MTKTPSECLFDCLCDDYKLLTMSHCVVFLGKTFDLLCIEPLSTQVHNLSVLNTNAGPLAQD